MIHPSIHLKSTLLTRQRYQWVKTSTKCKFSLFSSPSSSSPSTSSNNMKHHSVVARQRRQLPSHKTQNHPTPPHSTPISIIVSHVFSNRVSCVVVDCHHRFAKQFPKDPKPKTAKEEIKSEHEMRIEQRKTND